ncbi:hypothetical protein HY380_01245 [Candidatus Saccharibacteria bacterium]|nr:hypothetical protein [Candidatus Saccharibacteria bacterium]
MDWLKKLARQRWFVLLVVAGLIVLAWLLFFKDDGNQSQPSTIYQSVAIEVPGNWQDQNFTLTERSAGLIARFGRANPPATVTIRSETIELGKDFKLKSLPGEIVKKFKQAVAGFDLVSQKAVIINGYGGAQIRYLQNGDEYLLLVIPRQHQTYYLAYRAADADFEKVQADFAKINQAFINYLASY